MPQTLDVPVQKPKPLARKARDFASSTFRLLTRKRRGQPDDHNLLPLLIQVLAGFTKVDGRILEDELDSSLGFLRYDYPEAVYSDLRTLFQKALKEQQDLGLMAGPDIEDAREVVAADGQLIRAQTGNRQVLIQEKFTARQHDGRLRFDRRRHGEEFGRAVVGDHGDRFCAEGQDGAAPWRARRRPPLCDRDDR